MAPGMPRRKVSPSIPASAAMRATFTSAAPVPARTRWPSFDRNLRKTPPEPDQHAGQAAIADEQVGAAPDHRQRQIRRPVREKQRQIRFVGGLRTGAAPARRCETRTRALPGAFAVERAAQIPAIAARMSCLRSGNCRSPALLPDGSVPRAASWPGRA